MKHNENHMTGGGRHQKFWSPTYIFTSTQDAILVILCTQLLHPEIKNRDTRNKVREKEQTGKCREGESQNEEYRFMKKKAKSRQERVMGRGNEMNGFNNVCSSGGGGGGGV